MPFSFQKTILAAAAVVTVSGALLGAAQPARAEMTKEEVESIVRDYIANHPEEILASVQRHQENLASVRQKDAVKSNREDIFNDAGTPFVGNPKGDVTVVEFFDYNCGYCKKVFPQVSELLNDDKNVRVLFKDFPILGPTSETAAKWALAAHKQGKYFPYHQLLMKNRQPITDELLESLAKEAGLDTAKLKADAESTDVLIQIERNRSLATNMEIHGTPAFVVGDDIAPGAISVDTMKSMIAKARAGKDKKEDDKKE